MSDTFHIAVGQIWESRDPRDDGRRVTILSLGMDCRVTVQSFRRSTMTWRTLRTRYRKVSEAPS